MASDSDRIAAVLKGMRGSRVDDHKHASRGGRAYPKEDHGGERNCIRQDTSCEAPTGTKEVPFTADLQKVAETVCYVGEHLAKAQNRQQGRDTGD